MPQIYQQIIIRQGFSLDVTSSTPSHQLQLLIIHRQEKLPPHKLSIDSSDVLRVKQQQLVKMQFR